MEEGRQKRGRGPRSARRSTTRIDVCVSRHTSDEKGLVLDDLKIHNGSRRQGRGKSWSRGRDSLSTRQIRSVVFFNFSRLVLAYDAPLFNSHVAVVGSRAYIDLALCPENYIDYASHDSGSMLS